MSGRINKALPYDDLFALRQALFSVAPHLARIDQLPAHEERFDVSALGEAGAPGSAAFASTVADYYFTNPIARASKTMAECSAVMGAGLKAAAE